MEMVTRGESRLSMLYVEDEPTVREMMKLVLTRKYPEMEIHVAGNGRTGLELYREHKPDLVLTDARMPVMDGLQMAREILAENPAASIIMITACSDLDYMQEMLKSGIDRHVMKPINYKELFEAIDSSLSRITGNEEGKGT